MAAVVLVDAEGAIKAWAQTQGFIASLVPLRSGPVYLLLSRLGGTPDSTAGVDHARISAIVHGPTKQAALNGAVQYANAVWNIDAGTLLTPGVMCLGADVDSGPSDLPDPSGTSRYYVETTWHLGSA